MIGDSWAVLPLTCTHNAGIFLVATVVGSWHPWAVPKVVLVPGAVHLVPVDGPLARAEVQAGQGLDGPATAQLPAHHVGILQVPGVIAHCPPPAMLLHLHASSTGTPTVHQTQHAVLWGREGFVGDGAGTWGPEQESYGWGGA